MRRIVAFLLVICFSFFFTTNVVRGDELGDLQKEIDNLQKQLEASKNATTPLESEVKKLEGELSGIKSRLDKISSDLTESEKELQQQKAILASTVRNFYIRSFVDIPLLIIFAAKDASETLKLIAFQQTSSKTDKGIIRDITERVAKLADNKKRLASLRDQTSKQSQFLKGEIASAKSFQSEVQGKITALSARQQEIIDARSGSFTFTLGSGELADEYLSSAKGFLESAPGGYFAVFSFGGYSHRNGMSQYGARGRANSGQNFRDILSKYYPGKTIQEGYPEPGTIDVQGYGTIDFQQYLYGIAEMPSSWHPEALKAQAITARSYAFAAAKPICTNQNCQVYIGHSKGGAWEQAVNDTRGIVLTEGGQPVSSQYSSTAGGYLRTSGWDTTDGGGGANFTDKAYENIGGSPWLYKSWWRQGYSNQGSACGRVNPW